MMDYSNISKRKKNLTIHIKYMRVRNVDEDNIKLGENNDNKG